MTTEKIKPDLIDSFQGAYRFLSNFWPVQVIYEDIEFPSVEHAYVAAKTLDTSKRYEIADIAATRAGEVKRLGRELVLRPHWHEIKRSVMLPLIAQKFMLRPLRDELLDTGNAILIEGNNWGDTYWGICRGKGENHLGKIIMDVRTLIQARVL